MNLELTAADGYAVLTVVGSMTAVTASRLGQAIDGLIAEGSARVVVDLSRADAVDFSGLSALVAGLKAARLAGGDLRIAASSAVARQVLRSAHLDHVLREHPTPESAFGSTLPGIAPAPRRNRRRNQPSLPLHR